MSRAQTRKWPYCELARMPVGIVLYTGICVVFTGPTAVKDDPRVSLSICNSDSRDRVIWPKSEVLNILASHQRAKLCNPLSELPSLTKECTSTPTFQMSKSSSKYCPFPQVRNDHDNNDSSNSPKSFRKRPRPASFSRWSNA